MNTQKCDHRLTNTECSAQAASALTGIDFSTTRCGVEGCVSLNFGKGGGGGGGPQSADGGGGPGGGPGGAKNSFSSGPALEEEREGFASLRSTSAFLEYMLRGTVRSYDQR